MPPTDNLYKFIFISGILIYLYSLSFVVQQFRETRNVEFKYEKDSITVYNLIVKDSLKIEMLNYQFQNEKGLDLKKMDVLSLDSIILNPKQEIIFREYILLEANMGESSASLMKIKSRLKEHDFYEACVRLIFAILFVIGAGMIPFGLYQWYIKMHIPNMIRLDYETKIVADEKFEASHFFIKKKQFEHLCWFMLIILITGPFMILGWAMIDLT